MNQFIEIFLYMYTHIKYIYIYTHILYLFFPIVVVFTHFACEMVPGISLQPEELRKAREELLGCLLR